MTEGAMEQVASSRIREIGWRPEETDGEVGVLQIRFIRGDLYVWRGVTREDWEIFRHAPSVGQSFDRFIVPRYGKGERR